MVRASFPDGGVGSINLTIINTLTDNFAPFAGDGLPDDWQNLYFPTTPSKAAPGLRSRRRWPDQPVRIHRWTESNDPEFPFL